jgi:hypothetical protein
MDADVTAPAVSRTRAFPVSIKGVAVQGGRVLLILSPQKV